MSAWESVPTDADVDWAVMNEAEREEYITDALREISAWWRERRFHDRDGFFAEYAGSPECLALGHGDPDLDDPESHPEGWSGDPICVETKYGVACTSCEGECSLETPPSIWLFPGVLR